MKKGEEKTISDDVFLQKLGQERKREFLVVHGGIPVSYKTKQRMENLIKSFRIDKEEQKIYDKGRRIFLGNMFEGGRGYSIATFRLGGEDSVRKLYLFGLCFNLGHFPSREELEKDVKKKKDRKIYKNIKSIRYAQYIKEFLNKEDGTNKDVSLDTLWVEALCRKGHKEEEAVSRNYNFNGTKFSKDRDYLICNSCEKEIFLSHPNGVSGDILTKGIETEQKDVRIIIPKGTESWFPHYIKGCSPNPIRTILYSEKYEKENRKTNM